MTRPSRKEVAAKHHEIAVRYAAQRRQRRANFNPTAKRRADIEGAIVGKYRELPDTDDRDMLLQLWAWHNLRFTREGEPDLMQMALDLMQMAERLGGARPTAAEAVAIVRDVSTNPQSFTARRLGKLLGLTEANRSAIGITTIEAVDVTPAQRKRIKKEKDARRKRRNRRAKGIKPRAASIERAKPWKAEGISRATWWRRRKAGETTTSAASLGSAADTPVSSPSRQRPKAAANEVSEEERDLWDGFVTAARQWCKQHRKELRHERYRNACQSSAAESQDTGRAKERRH
jgi:hypothetical protein